MSDLVRRSQQAMAVSTDFSLPKWERLRKGLESFAGLELTGIAHDVREPFETTLAAVNGLFAGYDLATNDDLVRMSADDLQQGVDILHAAARRAIEGELDRIVAELDAANGKLPVPAIREAREHRDLMVPRLIRVLREATAAARRDCVPKGNAHFIALFLLSEFKAAEAFSAIVEAISLPDELPFDLFGDAVTSIISRVLAQFAGDTPELLDSLIANRELNEYVRWEAAHAYIYLVRDERLSRSEAVRRLQHHLRQAIDHVDQADATVISPLISTLTELAPGEAVDDIRLAYDRGLVESFMVCQEEVESSVAKGDVAVQQALARCPPTGITDTIEELRGWGCFQERPVKQPTPLPPKPLTPPPHFVSAVRASAPQPAPVIANAKAPRIGRNDRCPCGSGKKFKWCCARR